MGMSREAEDLSRVIEKLVRRLRSVVSSEELTQAAAAALGRLDEAGPLGITPLAHAEGVSQPAMTQLVDRLSDAGLVERRIPDGDRRSVHVHLTAAGRSTLNRRRRRRAERLERDLSSLSEADRAAIGAAIPALERLVAVPLQPHVLSESDQRGSNR